jgi:hypothetical protein
MKIAIPLTIATLTRRRAEPCPESRRDENDLGGSGSTAV